MLPDYHIFQCATCPHHPEFGQKKFIDHLRAVHHAPDRPQGVRSFVSRVDGPFWIRGSYQWTFDLSGVLVQAVEQFQKSRHPEGHFEADWPG